MLATSAGASELNLTPAGEARELLITYDRNNLKIYFLKELLRSMDLELPPVIAEEINYGIVNGYALSDYKKGKVYIISKRDDKNNFVIINTYLSIFDQFESIRIGVRVDPKNEHFPHIEEFLMETFHQEEYISMDKAILEFTDNRLLKIAHQHKTTLGEFYNDKFADEQIHVVKIKQ